MKKLIVLILVVAAGLFYFRDKPAQWRGIPAAADPLQFNSNLPAPFDHDDYKITPLASYKVKAVVLARERYHSDPGAKLSPIDLALGWGPMSTASVINDLSFSQSGRWYEYAAQGDPPLDPAEMASHSANTHCLPATDAVYSELIRIKRHELVTLEGDLVEVNGPGGWRWRSSLSRTDTRGGSCEVFWITKVVEHRRL
jgi:hypothetical protein